MKRLKSMYALALVVSIALTSCSKLDQKAPCLPNSLRKSVVAFYTFSNGSLSDLSVNNVDLRNPTTASPTTDRDGNSNCAYHFDNLTSSNEFLATTSTKSIENLDKYSISLWYQPLDTSRADGSYENLINCPNRNGDWSIGLGDCRKAVFFSTNAVWDIDLPDFYCRQEVIERTDKWSHLVATFKKSENEMKIYRNGVLQASSTGISPGVSGSFDYVNNWDIFLGKGYTGKLDDVIIFSKTLSLKEVKSLYSMETCCE